MCYYTVGIRFFAASIEECLIIRESIECSVSLEAICISYTQEHCTLSTSAVFIVQCSLHRRLSFPALAQVSEPYHEKPWDCSML